MELNCIDVSGIDRETLLKSFLSEMEEGLAGRTSSLKMIPSYIDPDAPVATGKPVAVLDAGGTNLRAALVSIDDTGKPVIEKIVKCKMPGTEGKVNEQDFFATFARLLEPIAGNSPKFGFCFSYPAETLPSGDARLICWSKQIEAPEIVGKLVGNGVSQSLAALGPKSSAIVLNDTVATLLAGKSAGVAKDYSSYVGFILGTGTNTAYVERNDLIKKTPGLPAGGSMAINVESGNFSKIEQTRYDALMDAATNDPGAYTFEKMISGAYLGRLCDTILRTVADVGGLPGEVAEGLRKLPCLTNKEVDDFLGGITQDNPLAKIASSSEARQTIERLCRPVYERAAVLTAINIAAAVIKTGQGKDAAHPVCVNVDGSTYYRTRAVDFAAIVQRELAALLTPRGLHCELIRVDEAPVIGAAVAALM